MSGSTSQQKGKRGEKEIVNLLRETGVDTTARRDPGSGSGNRDKTDVINSIDYVIEVKHQERLNIFNAIEQAENYSQMNHAVPSVFFKRNRMTEWWVAIPYSEWGKLKKRSKLPKTPSNNREFYWDLNQLKNALRKVMKHVRE